MVMDFVGRYSYATDGACVRCLSVSSSGEYHLDLIVGYGAVPVIVPRVAGVHALLDSFEPIHGVLLCEGEDIDPSLYDSADAGTDGSLSPEQLEAVQRLHPSDAAIDHEKDSIELRLARRCLEHNIPYLARQLSIFYHRQPVMGYPGR